MVLSKAFEIKQAKGLSVWRIFERYLTSTAS